MTKKDTPPVSKGTVEHLPLIHEIATRHEITLRELLGHTRKDEVVRARCELAHRLRALNLTYADIGRIINRDPTSVRQLLRRKLGPAIARRKLRQYKPATRTETERMFTDMCERGSAALLLAIFATGKMYRPMSFDEQAAAIDWAKQAKPVRAIGWMRAGEQSDD